MQLKAWILLLFCLIHLVVTNKDVHVDCYDKNSCFCNYENLINMPVFYLLCHML